MNIRTLKNSEIECRIQNLKEFGKKEVAGIFLLYKNSRVDMRILDEIFGIFGWERSHKLIDNQLFCTVRIYDKEKNMWISKEDIGVESLSEKEKGRASDSFKRCCVNIGIGRELYTAPFIWIKLDANEVQEQNGKYRLKSSVKFRVKEIEYSTNREIIKLIIEDAKGNVRFTYEEKENKTVPEPVDTKLTEKQIKRLYAISTRAGYEKDIIEKMIMKKFNKAIIDLNIEEYNHICNTLSGTK